MNQEGEKPMNETKYTTTTMFIDGHKVVLNRPILNAEERKRAEAKVVSALSNYKENRR